MSFGWSVGDIATAITVLYNLIEALDSCSGAAGEYREAVGFLENLKRTLDPLQTFTAWKAYPTYRRDIGEQVAHIKQPIESFLATILKYEPSLGEKAAEGRHRHVLRKLQWYIFISKKVLALRRKIESHMRVIDTLLQRLILDVVYTTQMQLPQNLRTVFDDTLRPELIALLQENLLHLDKCFHTNCEESHAIYNEKLASDLSERLDALSSDIRALKKHVSEPYKLQSQVISALNEPRCLQRAQLGFGLRNTTSSHDEPQETKNGTYYTLESLWELYYLVFLYLGLFLKNIFLALSQLVQPSKLLMPTLLAKYNISFLDAIGRPPRILPYEYFRSFKVLEEFIKYEFKNLPGSSWVTRGDYRLLSSVGNRVLTLHNWSNSVSPGSTVSMSMMVRTLLKSLPNNKMNHCPEKNCSGTWTRSNVSCWVTCPICGKEVSTSVKATSELDVQDEQAISVSSTTSQISAQTRGSGKSADSRVSDESHISHFKRISQELLLYNTASQLSQEKAPAQTKQAGLHQTTFFVEGQSVNYLELWQDQPDQPWHPVRAMTALTERPNRPPWSEKGLCGLDDSSVVHHPNPASVYANQQEFPVEMQRPVLFTPDWWPFAESA